MDKYAKKYADVAIRRIKEGLYLDEFVKDKRASVRAAVVTYQPRYRKAVFDNGNITQDVWLAFYKAYQTEKDPSIAMMKRFLSLERPANVNVSKDNIELLRYKIKAMTQKTPLIAKTMSRGELYRAGYAIWARDLTVEQLHTVDTMKYWLNRVNIEELKRVKLEDELSYLLDVVYNKTEFEFSSSVTLTGKYIQLRKDGMSIDDAVASL